MENVYMNTAVRHAMVEKNGIFKCAFTNCGKEYKTEGFCKRHLLRKHRALLKLDANRIEKEWKAKANQWEQENAIKEGDNYFDYVEASLKDALQEVQRRRKYYNDEEISIKEKVNEISYCIHHLTCNLQTRSYEGTNAIVRILEAFKTD